MQQTKKGKMSRFLDFEQESLANAR